MSSTWWVGEDELDEDQKRVITLPEEGDYLVEGPPGSGKTNMLLLRANYLYLAGHANILVVVFTRNLKEFISDGGANYLFPSSKIKTCILWQYEFLREYGINVDQIGLPDDFIERRKMLSEHIIKLIDNRELCNVYDVILLDETQDYWPEEIEVFRRLANNLFAVADSRQKIYEGEYPNIIIQSIFGEPVRLRYHYRNGLKICRLADGIVKSEVGYIPLADTSNYDEMANPSSVEHFRCNDIEEQANRIFDKLGAQLFAYPEEKIGIICPTRKELLEIWAHVKHSVFEPHAALYLDGNDEMFRNDKPIILTTFHSIKGLEVRSLHMAGCNLLKGFPNNRNMAYTAITRAKTALNLYYDDDIHGYLEAALKGLEPKPDLPTLRDVFGGKQ